PSPGSGHRSHWKSVGHHALLKAAGGCHWWQSLGSSVAECQLSEHFWILSPWQSGPAPNNHPAHLSLQRGGSQCRYDPGSNPVSRPGDREHRRRNLPVLLYSPTLCATGSLEPTHLA